MPDAKRRAFLPAFFLLFCLLVFALSPLLCACRTDAAFDSGTQAVDCIRTSSSKDPPSARVAAGENSATLLCVGDLLLHKTVRESGKGKDGYCYNALFAQLREQIRAADMSLINQETLSAGEAFGLSGYPCFNAPLSLADAVADAGFDAVLLANNHALDRGEDGLRACLQYYRKNWPDIRLAGVAESEAEAETIPIIEKNGIRFAILNYTYGTNGIPLPADAPYMVKILSPELVRKEVAIARAAADFVIVCPHWGTEYSKTPDPDQERYAQLFLACGVDLVVGTHPHVIQPIRWMQREDGHKMLVYYSLGNYVSGAAVRAEGSSRRLQGGMARITVARDEDGRTEIRAADVLPLITHIVSGYGGVSVYPFYAYTDTLADGNSFAHRYDPLFSKEYCDAHFREVFGPFLAKEDTLSSGPP